MCLAIPGEVMDCEDGVATVDFRGNRARVSLVLTPEARVSDWVLVHAGFAIARIDPAEARRTWTYLDQMGLFDGEAPGETSPVDTAPGHGVRSGDAGSLADGSGGVG